MAHDHHRWRLLALLATACGGAGRHEERPVTQAELVLRGGAVTTMDPEHPRATAVAIAGGRIAAVGSDGDVAAWIGGGTRVVELAGRAVTPGLVDGHAHLRDLGASLEQVALGDAASEQAAVAQIAAAAASRPAGEWILGHGWDQTLWSPAEYPGRALLDLALPDHPVAVERVDGHASWVNAAALARAGIGRDTPDPPGGKILHDGAGEPSGILVDEAMKLVTGVVPPAGDATLERRILAGAAVASAAGLTGVDEMGIDERTAAVYRKLAQEGRLPLRVYAYYRGELAHLERLAELAPLPGDGDARFAMRAVKFFADGALGSRGAALLAPYSDDPGNRGIWVLDGDQLAQAVEAGAAGGWQVGVHAIGDAANRAVLDAFERAEQAHPGRDFRFRVEHAQVVAPEDLPRFGRLGVLAAMQPVHCTSDMRWAEARLGPERVKGAYAWRSILDGGGRIVGSSDFPYDKTPPLVGIYAAVTRQDADGNPAGGWYPGQRLTLDEAIRIYTVEPAFSDFAEDRRGRIAVGLQADLTVFDRPLAADHTLLDTRVDMTIVGGRVEYERPR